MRQSYLQSIYNQTFFCSTIQNPKHINYSSLKKISKHQFEYYSILTFIFYFGMPYIIQVLAPGFSSNKEAFKKYGTGPIIQRFR